MANGIDLIVTKQAQDQVTALQKSLEKVQAEIVGVSESALKMSKNIHSLKDLKGLEESQAKSVKQIELLNKKLEAQNSIVKKNADNAIKQAERRANAEKRARESQVNKESALREKLATQKKREAAQTKILESAYLQLSKAEALAARKVQDIIARGKTATQTQRQFNKELKVAQAQFNKLRTRILQADQATGRWNRTGERSIGFLKNFASAFGVIGGIQLFAMAIRDTFNRVREFDKSMNSLAGVFRTTRSELNVLEADIISVAGSSIKTSNEVAKLAESLATLGKTPEQISKLLKPVVELGIGLNATSEEAGTFLVQMMNAFGASDDEAAKYADTIATIRTSTTLDFQKMRDSFQYLAPISKILNKDLAYTGAVVGILADNSLKAESAGRLLSTAQQKLAKDGKSLNDALSEISEAQKSGKTELEVLALASNLFGAQAAKVGVILANNTDKIDTNAQAIRDNGGALDDLVNEQLKSVDAQLKMLDSSWEEFILSLDNGEGVISKTFTGLLSFITGAIKGFTLLNSETKTFKEQLQGGFNEDVSKEVGFLTELANKEGQSIKEVASAEKERTEAAKKRLDILEKAAILEVENTRKLGTSTFQYKEAAEALDKIQGKQHFNNVTLAAANSLLKENKKSGRLAQLNKELALLKKQQKEYSNTANDFSDYADKIKAKQKEIDSIIKVTPRSIQRPKVEAFEVDNNVTLLKALEEQKAMFESFRDTLSTTNEEYERFNEMVDATQQSIDLIKDPEKAIKTSDDFNDSLKEQAEAMNSAADAAKNGEEAISDYLSVFLDDFVSQSGFETVFDILNGRVADFGKNWKTTFTAIAEVAQEAFAFVNQYSEDNFTNEKNRLKSQRDVSIAFAGDNADAKGEIEEQYQRKLTAINRKQAEEEKKAVLFSIAINTAQAIASALPNVPLSIAVGALGVAQAAIVKNQDIPEFKDGVRDFSGGLAYVGDGGVSEYVKTPDGKVSKTPNKATLVNLPQGTDVFSNKNEFIKEGTEFNSVSKDSYYGMTSEEMDAIIGKHFAKITTNVTTFDKNGFTSYVSNGRSKQISLNNRVTSKGFNV